MPEQLISAVDSKKLEDKCPGVSKVWIFTTLFIISALTWVQKCSSSSTWEHKGSKSIYAPSTPFRDLSYHAIKVNLDEIEKALAPLHERIREIKKDRVAGYFPFHGEVALGNSEELDSLIKECARLERLLEIYHTSDEDSEVVQRRKPPLWLRIVTEYDPDATQ